MKERPILFSGEMVRAILEGRKTQTRRVMKPQPVPLKGSMLGWKDTVILPEGKCMSPYGPPGAGLWVKETHITPASGTIYRADFTPLDAAGIGGLYGGWKPSIFMPRWASRITLEIVKVRCERLQDISEEDAKAEGAKRGLWCNDGVLCDPMDEEEETRASFRNGYGFLWESINGPGSWALNPWVWVIEFKRVEVVK